MSASTLPVGFQPNAVAAQVNAASANEVSAHNAKLKASYLEYVWPAFVVAMQSGQTIPAARRVPPQPPNGWELTLPDDNGYQWPTESDVPVCDVPPLPVYVAGNPPINKVAGVILMTPAVEGSPYRSAMPGDTFPSGTTTPVQPDGHTYLKMGWPGFPGHYVQVS